MKRFLVTNIWCNYEKRSCWVGGRGGRERNSINTGEQANGRNSKIDFNELDKKFFPVRNGCCRCRVANGFSWISLNCLASFPGYFQRTNDCKQAWTRCSDALIRRFGRKKWIWLSLNLIFTAAELHELDLLCGHLFHSLRCYYASPSSSDSLPIS